MYDAYDCKNETAAESTTKAAVKTSQFKMAIPELRPLKLGLKGPSLGSRLEQCLRARVKTNTALCPLVIWGKSGTLKSVCVGPASVVGQ